MNNKGCQWTFFYFSDVFPYVSVNMHSAWGYRCQAGRSLVICPAFVLCLGTEANAYVSKTITIWEIGPLVAYLSCFISCPIFTLKTWWCLDMEILSMLLALCEGNSPITGGFPPQRATNVEVWCFFFVCLNNCWAGIRELSQYKNVMSPV